MNKMLLSRFSPAILKGALRAGLDPSSVAEALGINGARFGALMRGAASISIREARLVEKRSGHSIGELILLGLEQCATPSLRQRNRKLLRETGDLMAALDEVTGT